MNLTTFPVSNAVPFHSIIRAQYSGNKITVPISSSDFRYASFEHVKGVPSSRSDRGIPLQTLKIIDSFIERLSNLKGETVGPKIDQEQSSLTDISNLLNRYSNELATIQQTGGLFNAGFFPEPGLLINTLT